MRIDLAGRRALVTGGTRGIGRAITELFAECGARVTATGTDSAALAEIGKISGIDAVRLDLLDRGEPAASVAELGEFDILVNNAGINRHAILDELDLEEFDRILHVNVRGAVALCKVLVPGMAKRGYGRVVNITSIFSEVSKTGRASYATSKFALYGFTRTLALDHATDGVLVNAVAPGFIGTEMTRRMLGEDGIRKMTAQVPLARLGTPQEVAVLVAFLSSSLNTFITGQNILIDGGFTST